MSLHRQLNQEGIRHANADSPTHARHVRQRKMQRGIDWVPESVSEENPAEVFKLKANGLDLEQGLYFIGNAVNDRQVAGVEFEQHLSAINWDRRWNYAEMKRGDRISMVRRKRSTPAVGETVVNLSPWAMLFVNTQLEIWEQSGVSASDRRDLLLSWLEPLRKEVVDNFEKATGWDVVGSYIHLDSNKVHFAAIHTRVGKDHRLLGEKSLRTVGPWSVAQARIHSIGAGDPADVRLKENLTKFRSRYGDKVPLDLLLHQTVDDKFESQVEGMGTDAVARYDTAKSEYRYWKGKARRESVVRSPGSQRIAWDVLRLITPLLPPPVQAGIRVARTAIQAFQVVTSAIDALPSTLSLSTRNPQLNKTL